MKAAAISSPGGPAGILFVWALSAACAHPTSGLRPTDTSRSARSYLYGRFYIDGPAETLRLYRPGQRGLTLRCADGQTYNLPFSKTSQVQVIAVPPSRCALGEIIYIDAEGDLAVRARVPGDPPGEVTLAGGTAYYLGDYFAAPYYRNESAFMVTAYRLVWSLTAAEDNYDVTTRQMKRLSADLASLPTVDTMVQLRKHLPGAPRADHLGSPGGPRDVMTPERVARVAPFTKRRYATPGECEVACPTGECLPFRAEGGPAMTCIVRCKTDKDCPEGLACNCPGSDGPDCRAIAQSPGDPMAGLCLSVEPRGQRR